MELKNNTKSNNNLILEDETLPIKITTKPTTLIKAKRSRSGQKIVEKKIEKINEFDNLLTNKIDNEKLKIDEINETTMNIEDPKRYLILY